MRNWWYKYWMLVLAIVTAVMLLAFAAYLDMQRQEEYKRKFATCMDDIHNVYVCETYSRQH